MVCIVNIKEEENSLLFRLRDNGVSYKRVPFHNYFFILEEDYNFVGRDIDRFLEEVDTVVDNKGVPFTKLTLKNNFDRYKLKELLEEKNIQTFLADLNSTKRWMLDFGKSVEQDKLKFAYLDLETTDLWPLNREFNGEVIAKDVILSFAIFSRDRETVYFVNPAREKLNLEVSKNKKDLRIFYKNNEAEFLEGEKELLKNLLKQFSIFDLFFAYNGDRFDFPYIKQRLEIHGLYDSSLANKMDYMLVYKKNTRGSQKSMSLQNVSAEELKDLDYENIEEIRKVDWKEKTGAKCIFELNLFHPEVLKEYNLQDVYLMDMIEKKNNFFELHTVMSKIVGCLLPDTMYNSKMGDYYLLREYGKENIIRPSKPTKAVIEKRSDKVYGDHVSGGYTFCYKPGVYYNLHGFDFTSHYPTAIITHNIGNDSFLKCWKVKPEKILSGPNLKFLEEVLKLYETREYIDVDGSLKLAKYNKKISELSGEIKPDLTMEEIMWKFVREYKDEELVKYLKDNNYTASDFDLNFDTKGWRMHDYRIYSSKESILSSICRVLLVERDKAKAEMKKHVKGSVKWQELNIYQWGLKTLANSMYGITALKSFRDYNFEVCDAITSTCRMLTKRCIVEAQKKGMIVTNGDTDSLYLSGNVSIEELQQMFFDFFNEWVKDFNPINNYKLLNPKHELVESKHAKKLLYEKTFAGCIVVKKKRYYYKLKQGDKYIYDSVGGAFMKKNTSKIAARWQKELCKDILDENFDKYVWKEKILELRQKIERYDLELDEIVNYAGLSRNVSEYGAPILDKKTGKQKVRKGDGVPMFASVPAHVKVAKRRIEAGEEIEVGDIIPYIVRDRNDGPINAISPEEFEKEKVYDFNYYWERIVSVLVEILKVVYPKEVYTFFGDCWGYKEKQLERILKKWEVENGEE